MILQNFLSAPDGSHVGPINLAIRVAIWQWLLWYMVFVWYFCQLVHINFDLCTIVRWLDGASKIDKENRVVRVGPWIRIHGPTQHWCNRLASLSARFYIDYATGRWTNVRDGFETMTSESHRHPSPPTTMASAQTSQPWPIRQKWILTSRKEGITKHQQIRVDRVGIQHWAACPFYWHELTLIPARISNHVPKKMWNEISYTFPY